MEEAEDLAAAWRGDRIALFVDEKSVAFIWRLRFDSPGSAARFEKAWKTLREKRAGEGPQLTRRSGSVTAVPGVVMGAPRVTPSAV